MSAKEKTKDINVPMNIAVVDGGRYLLAVVRMDNAYLESLDIEIQKAKAANYFDMKSDDFGKMSQPSKDYMVHKFLTVV